MLSMRPTCIARRACLLQTQAGALHSPRVSYQVFDGSEQTQLTQVACFEVAISDVVVAIKCDMWAGCSLFLIRREADMVGQTGVHVHVCALLTQLA